MHKYQDDSYGTIILPDTGDEYDLSEYDVWPVDDGCYEDDGRVITIALYPKKEEYQLMQKIKGYGEIRVPIGDNYRELWYIIEDFDIEIIGWDDGEGGRYNPYPIFKLTRRKDEDYETTAED